MIVSSLKQLREALVGQPEYVGNVLSFDSATYTATVELVAGGVLKAKSKIQVSPGQRVKVRGKEIETVVSIVDYVEVQV